MKKILIVDDEENILEVTKDVLEDSGYEVIIAQTGKEALEKLEKEAVNLILVDYFMAPMSGLELCKNIRKNEHTSKVKIALFTSGEIGQVDMIEFLKLNISDYIKKPFAIYYDFHNLLHVFPKLFLYRGDSRYLIVYKIPYKRGC